MQPDTQLLQVIHKGQSSFIYTYLSKDEKQPVLIHKTVSLSPCTSQLAYIKLTLQKRSAQYLMDNMNLCHHGETFHFQFSDNNASVTLSRRFVQGVNLCDYFSSAENQYKDFTKTDVMQMLENCIKCASVHQFFPSFFNFFINKNKKIMPNLTTFTGIKFLVFDEPISSSNFIQICQMLDSNIYERSPKERISQKAMVRFFCFYLFSLVLKKQVQILPKQDIPEIVDRDQAIKLLERQRTKIQGYLKRPAIKKRIREFQKQNQIEISTLLTEVLVQEKDISFGEVISKMYPSTFLSKNEKMYDFLIRLGSEKYKSFDKKQRKTLVQLGLWPKNVQSAEQRQIGYQFLAMRELNISCQVLAQYQTVANYLLRQNKLESQVSNLWQNLLKTEYFSKNTDYPQQIFEKQYMFQNGQSSFLGKEPLTYKSTNDNMSLLKDFAYREQTLKLAIPEGHITLQQRHLASLKQFWRLSN